jgi:2-keto-4-pentenoate hydratase/2-oxohepta-3-ene-1,7-dioic acid hydratase in catechol pathway
MKIARFAHDDEVSFGIVEGLDEHDEPTADSAISQLDGHPFGPTNLTGRVFPLVDVRLLAPVLPTKIIAVGRNYAAHIEEMGTTAPEDPMIFLKPSTSIIGPGEAIRLPGDSEQVDHEAELAVVIGRLCKDVPVERVSEVILGYTCANDVSARDFQKKDGQWGRAKGFDTFCPLGPWIATSVDPSDRRITCAVDDDLRQDSTTALMLRDVPTLVSWISRVMTLLPGDIIITGTPAGVGPLAAGQVVEVSIDGIGTLVNPVANA